MSLLDKRTTGDLIRLVIFIVVTTFSTGVLVVVIGNISFQSTNTYKAVFNDVTGLNSGDDVRVAGVRVGTVKGIKIVNVPSGGCMDSANKPANVCAEVTFTVADNAALNKSETATIRYRNLVGQRYIALAEGTGPATPLPKGGTIPSSQTFAALDLTTLFNGFKPLFAALGPDDINRLSYEMIQVFQGEGDNLNGLLQTTASLTSTLASRDQVIGSLIDNLNSVMATIGQRNDQFNNLITQFQSFLQGLVQDKDALLGPLNSISQLTTQTASLVQGITPGFVQDVKGLRSLVTNLNQNAAVLDNELQILPIKLTKVGRTAEYGSFFDFYLCQLKGNIEPLGVPLNLNLAGPGGQARCNLQ